MSDYLCEELIAEIFTRLPPKSLLRFRSLSKSLYTCISSPQFIGLHTFRSPQKIRFTHENNDNNKNANDFYTLHGEDELPLCLCPKRGYIGITTRIPFPCSNKYFRTVGSCNGTFCLKTKNVLTLWNPSIRRKVRVLECPRSSELPLGGIGFGFDPISDDYKIVWISCEKDTSFVYAVKTGTWCEIASPKPEFTSVLYEAFLFNGVLHWEVTRDNIKSQDIYPPSYILTFNLSTHVFGMIPLPGPTWEWLTTRITTIQDSLALISYGMDVDDTWIRVWRDASWSVVFKLGTGKLPVDGALQFQPQPQTTNECNLLLRTYGEGVQVYNPKTGMRSRVPDFNVASSLIAFRQCVETLHLLDMGVTACETKQL
ncbi:putative F-box protein At3g16210 [Lactuca sativa]|uniref:putative F-box protein At3g16210 n=1 Tax=Lactuca sativa TaxID=4236 RepID=UPI000CD9F02F|nr:putative F-box protein At3g16210 [Lactuca sativa]